MRARQVALIAFCLLVLGSRAFADGPVSINQVSVNQVVASGAASGGIGLGDNSSTITQVGSNNVAETDQLGSRNYASIGQFGNSNNLTIVQDSIGAVAIESQYGNGNQLTITQTGPHPQPVMVTQHR